MNWLIFLGLEATKGKSCQNPERSKIIDKGGSLHQQTLFFAFDAVLNANDSSHNMFWAEQKAYANIFYKGYAPGTGSGTAEFVTQSQRVLKIKAYPTSGLVAILLATRYCDHVDLYGYGTSQAPVWGGHNFSIEVAAVRNLTGTGEVTVFHEP